MCARERIVRVLLSGEGYEHVKIIKFNSIRRCRCRYGTGMRATLDRLCQVEREQDERDKSQRMRKVELFSCVKVLQRLWRESLSES
jgi:hypothetical protein